MRGFNVSAQDAIGCMVYSIDGSVECLCYCQFLFKYLEFAVSDNQSDGVINWVAVGIKSEFS